MTICFFINFGQNPPPSSDVAGGFIPVVKSYAVLSAVQLVGAVIMPHNIYLHSALVLTRKIDRRSPRRVSRRRRRRRTRRRSVVGVIDCKEEDYPWQLRLVTVVVVVVVVVLLLLLLLCCYSSSSFSCYTYCMPSQSHIPPFLLPPLLLLLPGP